MRLEPLEEEWNSYYGSKYAISMNSATSGLYASIGALGIGFGDEVIVSPYTMSACCCSSNGLWGYPQYLQMLQIMAL